MRVLICDGLRQQGVKIFQKVKNLEVEVRKKIGLRRRGDT